MEELKDKYKIILSERIFNKNFLGIGDAISGVKSGVKSGVSFVGKLLGSKPRMEITRSGNPNYQAAKKMVDLRNAMVSKGENYKSHLNNWDRWMRRDVPTRTVRVPTSQEVQDAHYSMDPKHGVFADTDMSGHVQQIAQDLVMSRTGNSRG